MHAYLPVRTSQKSLMFTFKKKKKVNLINANPPPKKTKKPKKYLTVMEDQHHFLEICNGIINRQCLQTIESI